jgi:signal transduction histidine kinase
LAVLRQVEAGDLSVRLESVPSTDEIGGLQRGFNAMVSQLEANMSELAEREQSYRRLSERLRALSARLAEVQETERKQLARELHDQAGRNLTALNLTLNLMRPQLAKTFAANDSVLAHLEDSLTLVKQTSAQLRDVMAELRPPMLDDYGLISALHWYANKFAAWVKFDIRVRGQEPIPRLPLAVENALFRITQEALNNAAKHAQANRVMVMLETQPKIVRLVITDDGVGFEPASAITQPGWGLLTMTERAEAVGGGCRIESAPGQGTRVVVEAPF